MPFFTGPNKLEFCVDSDEHFVINNLAECFTLNGKELSVFVLKPGNPYIEDLETINFINSSEVDIIVHPLFIHPWSFDYLEEHFSKVQIIKPWIQINWNKTLQGPNYLNFDYWAANLNDAIYSWGMSKYANTKKTKEYLFSCLNNIAKVHRSVSLYHLFNFTNFEKCLVSLSDDYDLMSNQKINEIILSQDIRDLSDKFDDQKFNDFYKLLPIKCSQEIYNKITFWIHDAYINSYVNIVTEHDFITNFVSEKSIKPFLTEQISLFVAGPGTVARLRSMGLDVFDDYVDHSYDNEIDPKIRLQQINNVIIKLSKNNWQQIYIETSDRRTKNRNLLLSGDLLNQFHSALKEKISTKFLQ